MKQQHPQPSVIDALGAPVAPSYEAPVIEDVCDGGSPLAASPMISISGQG